MVLSTSSEIETSKRIALLNDAFRTTFLGGTVTVTAGLHLLADVVEQWEHPAYLEWGERTAWRLFNATTFALAGKIVENSDLTPRLHTIIDGVCAHKEMADAA